MKRNIQNYKILLGIISLTIVVLVSIFGLFKTFKNQKVYVEKNIDSSLYFSANKSSETLYLSDIDYIDNQSYVGYDKLRYDEIQNGAKISLKIDNQNISFEKGIWAHATSQVTYNISEYSGYKYFTAYIGLDTTSAAGDGVRFTISTSEDGTNWQEAGTYDKLPSTNATFIEIDISDANYIRLYANALLNKTADHAVYADAKLVTENYREQVENLVPSKEALDQRIKEEFASENVEENEEFELVLLKRELMDRIGNTVLKIFLSKSEENRNMYHWLTSDVNNIRLYLLGGKPNGGNYLNSLTQLSRLYNEYADDFELTETLNNPYQPNLTYGELYKKMAISLSLTHSQTIGSWMQGGLAVNQSDALRRYAIYKYMHKNGMLRQWDNLSYGPMFEALRVEEMRLVMNGPVDDESILWLNSYVQDRLDQYKEYRWITPHPYIAYTQPNYGNPIYYSEENKNYFNDLFSIKDRNNSEQTIGLYDLEYTIPGGKTVPTYHLSVTRGTLDNKIQKVWMNFRNKFGTGAICGGIANSGANIRTTHGIPAMFIYQPYHGAILHYAKNAEGKGYWGIDNDVDGWALSSSSSIRFLMGWGNESWNIESPAGTQWIYMFKYNAVYIVLGQEAINDYDNFVKAEEQIYLAKVYADDTNKQEELYNKALEIQPINLDAWVGLINLYKANPQKEEKDYYKIAERIAESLKMFPLPMKHLLNLIKPKLTSSEYIYQFTLLQTRALTASSVVTNEEALTQVVQPDLVRGEARFLLGRIDKTVATFSFDGENAGKIVLSNRFDGNGVRWDYVLTGKGENESWDDADWHEVFFTDKEEHKWQLTPEELELITADNDIYIHIVGVSYSDQNVYKIDILNQDLPTNLYANDWENKVIGATEQMEWRYTEKDIWKSYKDETPNLNGNKTVQVRLARTGTKDASPVSELYTFTEDNWPNTRKYIPIEHLTIHSYSSQSLDASRPFYAPNAIDGNITTIWHTNFKQNVLQLPTKPFIAIELDEPKNISAVEFVQRKYRDLDPIFIKNAIIYVSNDGSAWIEAGRKENLEQNEEFKSVEFNEAMYGKYVKIEMETYDMFASLAMVNLFEDKTKVTHANFSFDGEDAGKIVLVDEFKGSDFEYSLDNGTTWKNGNGDSHQLSKIELQQINADDGIKIRINGNESIIRIGIQDIPTISAYVNDLENRLIGTFDTNGLEWKIEGNSDWISYETEEPIVSGNKKLFIRKKATSIYMASDAVEFAFTADNQLDNAKYVSIKHLSIHAFSSTTPNRGEQAENAIDGLPTTMWHTNRTTSTMYDPRWIIIELDEPRYISKIEYVRIAGYAYGILKNGVISVSIDGENYEVAQNIENLYNPSTAAELVASPNSKDIVFSESKKAKYIKIELTKSCDYVHGNRNGVPMDYFFSAAMFNIFEDMTKAEYPVAEVEYSTTELTNEDVIATLVNENMNITVTNNNGSRSYTFKKNGTFTFEFVNDRGIKGTATATVNNIDKTIPVATIEYSKKTLTNQEVTATITFDKTGVKIVDENGIEIPNGNTYVFTENGSHEFRFKGPAGNIGTAIATVDWIDKVAPNATITYSAEYKTNQDIIATITFDKENVKITNNNGKNTHTFTENGTFTFEFKDVAGNTGTAVANVQNIDKTLPVVTIEYDIKELTNENVTATITFDKTGVKIVDENGIEIPNGNTYVFTENGSHEFKFIGPAGNTGSAVAQVDWIDKEAPNATIKYDIEKITKEDVTATITFNEKNVKITNNTGKNTYLFKDNGTFTFEFEDMAGNKGSATATVDWIDKVELIPTITYDINDITNQDVTATITFNKQGVKILDSNGNEIPNGNVYVFKENGTHAFRYVGPAGNTGTMIARVDWIDKTPPAAIITYDINSITNKDVTATITFDEGGVTIIDENGNKVESGEKHVFKENGTYIFYYIGPLGNIGTAVAEVNWIDKKVPNVQMKYSKATPTKENVTATITFDEENVKITNNDGKDSYLFEENGEFTFEFTDRVGNTGSYTVHVDWIDRVPPTATIEYNTIKEKGTVIATLKSNEEVIVINNNGKNTYTFRENGEFTFEFADKAGNANYVTAKVSWIEKKLENNNQSNLKPIDKTENNTGEITNPDEEIYQNMVNGSVSVKLSNSILSKYQNAFLEYQDFALSNSQKEHYGKDSHIYKVSLKTKENKEIDLSTITIMQTVKLDKNKKFEAIYVIRKDGSMKKIDAKVNEDEITFEETGLGTYLISYKSDSSESEKNNIVSNDKKVEKNKNYIPYAIGVGSICIIGSIFVFMKKRI